MRHLALLLALAPLVAGAVTWHPAPDWRERPDPVASTRARKGGTIRFNGGQPPKSLNGYVDNNHYTGMMFSLMYDSLIATDSETLDFTPALARRWAVSDDGAEFTFVLDERATWSDGRPVTAEDVVWTFASVVSPKSDTGPWKVTLGAYETPVAVDARTVRFRKKAGAGRDWRDLIHCGTFPVMPKHAFASQDFNKLELLGAPVGGAYRLARVAEQVETEFARVPQWWRRDLPATRHTCNFDRIVVRYYADNENAFEALKKRAIDVYPVYSARIMKAETHGEKFDRNWILRRRVENHKPVGFQGFAMNMRRFPFDDAKTRRAMAMLIDRETMNRTMMYGEYFMLRSYYEDLYDAAHPCRNPLHPYDVAGAKKLLAEAGWKTNPATGLLAKGGRDFRFTFLSRSAGEDKFLAPFDHALRACGIAMEITRKDFAGWMRDMDAFNFQMTWAAWGAGVFRTPETMWLGAEAGREGSNNACGFKSDEVDRLIKAEKTMETMAERADAYRRIDALIAAETPYALLWMCSDTRLLYWNKFGMPETVLGRYSGEEGALTYWWYDEDRAEELAEAMSRHACLPSVPERVPFDAALKRQAEGAR